jgi:hypothetical protein
LLRIILLARNTVFMRMPIRATPLLIVMMGTRMAVVALGVIIIIRGAIMLTRVVFDMRGPGIPIMRRGKKLIMRRTIMWVGIFVRIVIVVVNGARVFVGRGMMRRREKIVRILVLTMRIQVFFMMGIPMPLFVGELVLTVRILFLVIGGIVRIDRTPSRRRTRHARPSFMARGTRRAGKARGTGRTGRAGRARWRWSGWGGRSGT